MARKAVGTITMSFDIDEELAQDLKNDPNYIIEHYTVDMVDEILSLMVSDIKPAIEMEIVDV